MTDVTLPYPRTEAAEIVKAAFERMADVDTYEVVENGSVIVGKTGGGLTSFGEEVVVAFPEAKTGSVVEDTQEKPQTVVSVSAQAQSTYNLSANPWKHKTDFVSQLHELKGTPINEIEIKKDIGGDDETTTSESSSDSADAMLLGAKFMLVIFLGLLLIGFLLAGIALVM